jgi:hypothetical protein
MIAEKLNSTGASILAAVEAHLLENNDHGNADQTTITRRSRPPPGA